MIIGYEAKRLYQNLSGLGNYSRNTLNILARYFPENRYVLFAPQLSTLYTTPDCVSIITPGSRFSKKLRFIWRAYWTPKLLKCNHIDVFHGLSNGLPLGIEKTGIPSVFTVHDLIFMRFPGFYKKIDRMLYKFFMVRGCRTATKIIAISQQTKTDLINLCGVDPKKIEVIYQSCNKQFYEKVDETQKSIVRQKYALPDKFLLSVGTIEQRKNQLAILEGLVKEKLEIPLVILGKPTEYKMLLDDFIKENDIRRQIIFLHNTGTEELQAIYQMAEIMVYPSFFEGFGLPVLEAQASGCPVITSNISSMPEAGGDGAMYIDPANSAEIGNAIRKIMTDSRLKKELIQKGTAHSLLFSDQLVAEKLMGLYQSLVSGHAS
jgi:glycosyltransferase involved in cell wall biosynthesis